MKARIIIYIISFTLAFVLGRLSVSTEQEIILVTKLSENHKSLKYAPTLKKVSKIKNITKLLENAKKLEKRKVPVEEIIAKYKNILEIEPNNVEAIYRLAYQLKQASQEKESIELYKKCVELDPTHSSCNFYLSLYAFYDMQTEEAYSIINRCIHNNPKQPACHYYLARLNHKEGKYQRAIEYYQDQLSEYSSIGRSASTKNIHYDLAQSYNETGRTDEYLSHIKKSCNMGYVHACNQVKKLNKPK